jgi:hypothetical protein
MSLHKYQALVELCCNDVLRTDPQAVLYIEGSRNVFSQNFSSFLNTGECLAAGILQRNKSVRITELYGVKHQYYILQECDVVSFDRCKCNNGANGGAVDALGYKPEGRGFDSLWCHWNFSLTNSFQQQHYDPEVDSASNINEYQEYFLMVKGGRCLGLKNLPLSCADCLEIWEPQTTRTLRTCPDL